MERFNKMIAEMNTGHTKKPIGEYTFKFGKYVNRTFDDVFDADKMYVHFCITKLDKEKNKVLIDYYKTRIEEEFGE
jgi:hypothetical protein